MSHRVRLWAPPRSVAIVATLSLLGLIAWPLAATMREAWRYGDAGPVGGWSRPLDLGKETLRLVLATQTMALPLGVILAVLLFRTDFPGRRIGLGLMLLGALLPMPLHAIGWLGALGNAGRAQLLGSRPLLAGWPGAAFVHAMGALPWVVLLAGIGLRAVEPWLEELAVQEMPALAVIRRITLRRALGGILAAALMTAVLTATDMSVTDLLQVRTYAEEAYLQEALGNGPAAMAVVSLPPLLALGLALLSGVFLLLRADPSRLPSASVRPRIWRLGRWWLPLAIVGGPLVIAGLGVPVVGMIWRAGRLGGSAARGLAPSWSLDGFLGTLGRSARVLWPYLLETSWYAAIAATLTLALAAALAWLAREPGPWRGVAALSAILALAPPAPVAGMSMVLAYRNVPGVYGEPALLILALILRVFPYALAILWVALRAFPRALLERAALDGLGPWSTARLVVAPLSRDVLLAAWVVAFLLALGELPASKIVEAPGMRILSVFLWGLLHTGVDSQLAGVALILLCAFAAIGGLALALVRRLDSREHLEDSRNGREHPIR